MKNVFAKNLISLRKQKKWRQLDLAKNLKTTQRKVSYWENGKIEPDLDTLIDIAELFEITVDELIKQDA